MLIERLVIYGKGMQRKRRTEQPSIENGKVMELKLIKHDKALEGLAGQLRNPEAPGLLSRRQHIAVD